MLGRAIVAGILCAVTAVALAEQTAPPRDKPLGRGERAPHLKVAGLDDEPVDLASLMKDRPTVLVMLRGFPGYQCPICSRQVAEYRLLAQRFEEHGVRVVLVYPGDSPKLAQLGKQFLDDQALPAPLTMVIDKDYRLTNAYGLRWEAPRETAYPATFVVDAQGLVAFARVSKSHGGRVPATDALEQAKALAEMADEAS